MTILMRVSSTTLVRGHTVQQQRTPGIGVLVRNITIQHKNGIRNKVNENQLTATNYGNELWNKKVDKIEISPPAQ